MRGDYASAIEDFKFTIESMPEYEVFKHLRSKRQAWVVTHFEIRSQAGAAFLGHTGVMWL